MHILHCTKYTPQSWCVSLDKSAGGCFFWQSGNPPNSRSNREETASQSSLSATMLLLLKEGRQPAALFPYSLPLENAFNVQEGPKKAWNLQQCRQDELFSSKHSFLLLQSPIQAYFPSPSLAHTLPCTPSSISHLPRLFLCWFPLCSK